MNENRSPIFARPALSLADNLSEMPLNLAWLTNRGACQPACDAFRERWGDRDVPLADVMLALAEHPRGLDWWDWLQNEDMFSLLYKQYEAATLTHCEQHRVAHAHAMHQYLVAIESVDKRYSDKSIDKEYWVAIRPLRNELDAARESLDEQLNAASRAELRRLAAELKAKGVD